MRCMIKMAMDFKFRILRGKIRAHVIVVVLVRTTHFHSRIRRLKLFIMSNEEKEGNYTCEGSFFWVGFVFNSVPGSRSGGGARGSAAEKGVLETPDFMASRSAVFMTRHMGQVTLLRLTTYYFCCHD